MIRRKLLLLMGSLITVWVIAAIVAIILLNGTLTKIDAVREVVFTGGMDAAQSAAAVGTVDRILMRMAGGEDVSDATLQSAVETLAEVEARLRGSEPDPLRRPEVAAACEALGRVRIKMEALARAPHEEDLAARARATLATSIVLHELISDLPRLRQDEIQARQQRMSDGFRAMAFGLGLAFLVLINGSLLMLLRVSVMVLRPVERLVEATHHLANEEFDYRVSIDQNDEFDELARAYNSLAEQLQDNEHRRLETFQQVATTLNHELNNAFAVIDMQLQLVERTGTRTRPNPESFQQIHRTLERMQGTIKSLSRIRRIVLTDYSAGIRMLDLDRSIEDENDPTTPCGRSPAIGSTEA